LFAVLQKRQQFALIWLFKVEHMPWGPPGMTFSAAPFTSFADKRAESALERSGRRRHEEQVLVRRFF